MRIKLVRRSVLKQGSYVDVYDIYVGIRSIFFMFIPLGIKWYVDAKDLTEQQAKERVWNSYLSVKGTKLITETEYP